MSNIETRDFELRSTNIEEREVSGIAVPYDTPTTIGGYTEIISREAVQNSKDVMLYWRHEEPIGLITEQRHTDAGWEITARISETPRGDEAYTLVRDGVIKKFSIGFEPVEQTVDREANTVTRTNIRVREVSLVPMPAYDGAVINEVRQELTESEETNKMSDAIVTPADLDEVREAVETVRREVAVSLEAREIEPAIDTRSAGAILSAIAKGDESAMRAYTGATTADTVVRNSWVGDLTRIVEEAAPLLSVFSRGALPTEGNFIEYATLTSNSVDVDTQAAEGDDLGYGEVVIDSHTAAISTLGGYSELSVQSITRSSIAYLDHVLRAQAIAAGKAVNTKMRAAYATAVAAQITAANTVELDAASFAAATYADWLNAAIDAQVKFQAQGLSVDALIVSPDVFKSLLNVESADGRPVFLVTGAGSNNVGSLNVRGLSGDLASIPVIMDATLTDEIAFVNGLALRAYTSPVVRLQDENIINLSRQFSVYTFLAIANEVPSAIVPVVLPA